MSSSTAIARINDETKAKDAEVEKMPVASSIIVPTALLLAAESVASRDTARSQLNGVFLHSVGDRGRIVGTDGARMFVGSFQLPKKDHGSVPDWMGKGVILSREDLRSRLVLLQKLSDDTQVNLTHVKGSVRMDLSDMADQTCFRIGLIDGTFPEYDRVLGASSFVDLDAEGATAAREWQAVGINSSYLKQCGDIAKMLERGPDNQGTKSKNGTVIRAFNGGGAEAPMVFDFSSWPGALLIVLPIRLPNSVTSKETAQILAPQIKSTVAALRAHATRWDMKAKAADDEKDEAGAKVAREKAAEFTARVAAILVSIPSEPAIKAEKKAAEPSKPEAKAAPVEDKPEAEAKTAPVEDKPVADDEDDHSTERGAAKPTIKRTRIVTKQKPQQNQAAA